MIKINKVDGKSVVNVNVKSGFKSKISDEINLLRFDLKELNFRLLDMSK